MLNQEGGWVGVGVGWCWAALPAASARWTRIPRRNNDGRVRLRKAPRSGSETHRAAQSAGEDEGVAWAAPWQATQMSKLHISQP